ncbi:hypothetical protein PPBDW_II1458 [Photobacterium kishitanii]|nr:hypothetical protein PPBDW_II1458 [Photobacterium kishitanii]
MMLFDVIFTFKEINYILIKTMNINYQLKKEYKYSFFKY